MDLGDLHSLTSLEKPEGWKTQHQDKESEPNGEKKLQKGCS